MLAAALPPVTTTIHEWVTRTPDAVAVSHLEREWTYRELWAAGEHVARGLKGNGLIKGARVAILGDRSLGTIASMLGTLLTGGIMVPLDHSLPVERSYSMASAADVRFLLLVGDVEASPKWAATVCVIRVRPDGAVCDMDTNAVLPSMAGVAADDPAYIFFTSGTSGNPKGILGNHGGLAHFIG
jgi:non-ribosomal peptide synthetase component F